MKSVTKYFGVNLNNIVIYVSQTLKEWKKEKKTYGWVDEANRSLPNSNTSVVYHREHWCYHWSSCGCPKHWNKITFYLNTWRQSWDPVVSKSYTQQRHNSHLEKDKLDSRPRCYDPSKNHTHSRISQDNHGSITVSIINFNFSARKRILSQYQ
jgi:hypothetical protein